MKLIESRFTKEQAMAMRRGTKGKYVSMIHDFDAHCACGGDECMEVQFGPEDTDAKNRASSTAHQINKAAKAMGRKDVVAFSAQDRCFIVKQYFVDA